jgi:hypothetical protein
VRGLSAQEYDDLQNGRGMGMARAAELNGYPGPRHVLDLRQELQLNVALGAEIEAVFHAMDAEARGLGADILAAEQALNVAFEEGAVSEEFVASRLEQLGALYGRLRSVHMRAHVAVRRLLTPEQVVKYNQLRGYSEDDGHDTHSPHGS